MNFASRHIYYFRKNGRLIGYGLARDAPVTSSRARGRSFRIPTVLSAVQLTSDRRRRRRRSGTEFVRPYNGIARKRGWPSWARHNKRQRTRQTTASRSLLLALPSLLPLPWSLPPPCLSLSFLPARSQTSQIRSLLRNNPRPA